MNLFAEIDYKATANNVDRLLKIKLPKLLLRCGRGLTDLSSPQLSFTPAHSNGVNHQEDQIIDSLDIERVICAIHHTIYHCSEISKIILVDTYIRDFSAEQIIMSLPYERSQYFHKLKPRALNEFADAYDYWQKRCNVSEENIIDLHEPIIKNRT